VICRALVDGGKDKSYDTCPGGALLYIFLWSTLVCVVMSGKSMPKCITIPTDAGVVAAAVSAGMHWKVVAFGALVDGRNIPMHVTVASGYLYLCHGCCLALLKLASQLYLATQFPWVQVLLWLPYLQACIGRQWSLEHWWMAGLIKGMMHVTEAS